MSSSANLKEDARLILKLCNVDQLPSPGALKSFASSEGLQVCVAAIQQEDATVLAAFENRCPHQNAPLSAGHMEGCEVVCPYHAWRFNTLTGAGEHADDPGLLLYEIRQYGNEVFVRIPRQR